ncbi:MAG: thiol reductant ABC exporter subunit CydD [Candidatus Promineifilaceae bacterium]|jgi:ATP-binding cassette subfamily C protein CydCD
MIDRDLWREGRRSKWLWLTVFLSALGGLVIVVQAYLLSQSVNSVFLGSTSRSEIAPILAFLLAAIFLRSLLAWGRETAAHRVAADIKCDLRDRLFDQLAAEGPLRTARGQTGEQTAVLTEGIEALEAYFAEYLPQLFVSALIPLTILIVILPADPISGLVLLLTAPLMMLFMILIGRTAERLTKRQFNQLSRMSGYFLDILQGLTTLKQLGQSRNQARNIARISDRFRQTTMSVLRIAFLSAMVLELLSTLSVAIIAVSIGLRLLSGGIDFALGFFILILAPEFYLPLRQLGQRFHAGMSGTAAAVRIFAMLDEAELQSCKVTESRGKLAALPPYHLASIFFEEVSVTYPGRDRPALKDVSLIIEPGETVALVGPSGAGKSTLSGLLLRFIEPDEGRIRVGEQDLAALDPEQWREQIAWVPQSPALFQGSIADNIRLARPGAAEDEIIAAARLARLHDYIIGLPAGYETPIGERGLRLSGGQAQRLALARAFLKDAPLLILDEPTAHLDRQTEAELQEATRELMAGRTILVIAHRPHTIESADRIVRLERGRVLSEQLAVSSEQLSVGSEQLAVTSEQLAVTSEQLSVRHPTSHIPHPTSHILRRLLGFLKPYKARIALSVLLGALTIGCGVALLATSAYLISAAALQPSIADLSVAIVGVRAFGLSRGILRYLERLISHDVTFRVLAEIRTWFYLALEPLAPARLQQRDSGELLTHIIGDVEALLDFYVRAVYPVLVALLAGIGVLIFFGAFARQLALVMLLFLLLYGAALPWLIHVLAGSYATTLSETRTALQSHLVEGIQGMADLIAFGRMADWQTAVHGLGARLSTIQRRAANIAGLRSGLGELLTYGAMWSVLWLAIPLSTNGQIAAVTLAALALAAVASFELVQPLPQAAQALAESLAAARRLFAVVEGGEQYSVTSNQLSAVSCQQSAQHPKSEIPRLGVRDLRFRYAAEEPWVLDGLSFELPPGGKLLLSGRSGAGKTTLLNLLLRFWDYQEGDITLNDRSIREYDADAVRACFGVVEQRPYLFNTSIYDNLRIARPEAGRDEIETATRLAQLHDFIAGLPDGYDTQVGSLGMALSGGERQRLAIARALLRDAPILLLDEPTVHLDPQTAQAVLETVLTLAEDGRSLLLITHEADSVQDSTDTFKQIRLLS